MNKTLTATAALHARPASLLARELAQLDANVTLSLGERQANGSGALSLLALAIEPGDTVLVHAEGGDAAAALDVVSRRLSSEKAG